MRTHGRPKRSQHAYERGAAALNWVGVMLLSSVIICSIAIVPASKDIAESARRAICAVAKLVGIPCDAGPEVKPEPTEPCVVNRSGNEGTFGVSIAFVDLGGGKGLLVEQLSNGKYRLTEFDMGSAGVSLSTAVGGGVTVNDARYALAASAGLGAGLIGESGTVWEVDSKEEADNLANTLYTRMGVETAIPGLGTGFNWLAEQVGIYDIPEPTSTYFGGGAQGDASANLDLIVAGGELAGGVTAIKGQTDHADGSQTIYLEINATVSANGSITGLFSGTHPEGTLGRAEINKDADGNMTSLTYIVTDPKTGEAVSLTLPADSAADQKIINDFLGNPMDYVDPTDFVNAAMDHGTATKVVYDTSKNLDVTAFADFKIEGVGVGLNGSYTSTDESLSDATYWNGTEWVPWTSCNR